METVQQINHLSFSYDRLYQKVNFTTDNLRLFQTKELSRLREVSLSAVPTWTIPTSVCASKFEHSLGVGHLARIISTKPEFKELEKDLYFASLAHDLATPPFSHLSESCLINLLGVNHEDFIDEILDGSEFAQEVQRQGGSIERVSAFVKGTDQPYSDLINGSIDLDNLDNTLRYGLSIGLLGKQYYSPESLAKAYCMQDGQLVLKPEFLQDLNGWENCRSTVYKFIYNPANLTAGIMIWRALYLAAQEGKIKKDYFFKTDAQAYAYLEERCNSRTKALMEQARRWQYYSNVFSLTTTSPSDTLQSLTADSWNRGLLADKLSNLLSIPPEKIAVFMGKNRSFKQIHLPIIDHNGIYQDHTPQRKLTYITHVYVHPDLIRLSPQINDLMNNYLQPNQES